jgi:mRNA interferase MazF
MPSSGATGLKRTSLLRAEKLAVVHESVFERRLGTLPTDLTASVQQAVKEALFLA